MNLLYIVYYIKKLYINSYIFYYYNVIDFLISYINNPKNDKPYIKYSEP